MTLECSARDEVLPMTDVGARVDRVGDTVAVGVSATAVVVGIGVGVCVGVGATS